MQPAQADRRTFAIAVKVPQPEPVCFVAMPFSPDFDRLGQLISDAVNNHPDWDMKAVRTDKIHVTRDFPEEIVRRIRRARVVVAVCTPEKETGKANPNVMYELGMAQALGKPTVIMTSDDPPADIRHQFTLWYRQSQVDDGSLESRIREAIGYRLNDSVESVMDKYYSDHGISVAQARCVVLGESKPIGDFKTVFDFANTIHSSFQLIEATYLSTLKLLAKKACAKTAVGSVVGDAEVSEFNREWAAYDRAFGPVYESVYENLSADQFKVEECLQYLSERTDETSKGYVEQCKGDYDSVVLALQNYEGLHQQLKKTYRNDFVRLKEPRSAKAVEREMERLADHARDVRLQASTLMVSLVNLIVR